MKFKNYIIEACDSIDDDGYCVYEEDTGKMCGHFYSQMKAKEFIEKQKFKGPKFFSEEHKVLAHSFSNRELKREYEKTEKELLNVAKSGDEDALKGVMKKHGSIEYAMLYQKTPEYRLKKKEVKKNVKNK